MTEDHHENVTRRSLLGGLVGGGLLTIGLGGGLLRPGPGGLDTAFGLPDALAATGPTPSPAARRRKGAAMPLKDIFGDLPVHTRKEWEAVEPKVAAEILPKGPDTIVVHHTDTPNTSDMSIEHAFDLSRQIQAFHMQGNGWNDSGQQLTISRGGVVMEGRNRSLSAIRTKRNVLSAQTLHENDHTLGIENEGTYMTADIPVLLWTSLVQVCASLCRLYDLDPHKAIAGHRDFNDTDCPGDILYASLPSLREAVADALED